MFFYICLLLHLWPEENSLGSNKASITQNEMLINRQASLRLKIDELEIIKNNTQNPFLYKKLLMI